MRTLAARLKKAHRVVLTRLRGGELTPARLAASVALGLFIGILPLYGAHLPLCAFFALALRLDVFLTYVAANISVPPMIPFLLYGGLQLGAFVLTGSFRVLSSDDLVPGSMLSLGAELLVGSLVLASLAALVGGALSYVVARWLRARRLARTNSRFELALERTQRHYHEAPKQHRYYVASKLKMDPLTRELFEAYERGLIAGDLLDVGAGRGQFALFLAELGAIRTLTGFDHDRSKIELADAAARAWGGRARFSVGDLRAQPLPQADTILLLDVLHYLNTLEQDAVLGRVAMALRPGGFLFVRETNRGSGMGSFWASQFEKLAKLLGINRGERLVFRSPAEYERTLIQLGLEVERAKGRGALDNVLLIARHPEPSR